MGWLTAIIKFGNTTPRILTIYNSFHVFRFFFRRIWGGLNNVPHAPHFGTLCSPLLTAPLCSVLWCWSLWGSTPYPCYFSPFPPLLNNTCRKIVNIRFFNISVHKKSRILRIFARSYPNVPQGGVFLNTHNPIWVFNVLL